LEKKREIKAATKLLPFKMKLKKTAAKNIHDHLESPLLKQIAGNRQIGRKSPSPTKSEEKNPIINRFEKSKISARKIDFFAQQQVDPIILLSSKNALISSEK
jgi:hypothetical protein